ncbi:MAG: hypothetical protein LBE55_02150 [Clostridiales bacterium]|jgi:hypothetical protein|nr:hypothetical protein [Clostridiales bacterium]
MKKRVFILICVLILLSACASTGEAQLRWTERPFELGSVTLISNDVIYQPGMHFPGGTVIDSGDLLSYSGITYEMWIEENLDELPKIQYSDDIQVVVEGQYGHIRESWNFPSIINETRIIQLLPENFINGIANATLPSEGGVYLLSVVVSWSGGGDNVSTVHYIFKIEK